MMMKIKKKKLQMKIKKKLIRMKLNKKKLMKILLEKGFIFMKLLIMIKRKLIFII